MIIVVALTWFVCCVLFWSRGSFRLLFLSCDFGCGCFVTELMFLCHGVSVVAVTCFKSFFCHGVLVVFVVILFQFFCYCSFVVVTCLINVFMDLFVVLPQLFLLSRLRLCHVVVMVYNTIQYNTIQKRILL